MTERGRLLDVDDPRWTEALRRLQHDVYHLPEYVRLLGDRAGARAGAFLVNDGDGELLVPILVRQLPDGVGEEGWCDASSPYGYPGPLFSPSLRSRQHGRLWAELVRCANASNIVSLFIRSHPLLTPEPDKSWESTTIVEHGRVVYVDLAEDIETIYGQRREDTHRDLRSLKKAGFGIVMDDWHRYPDFIRIYRETMRRVGADEYYLFENGYFEGLRRALDGRLHLCTVVAPNDDIAAGGLFMECRGIYQYHLGATNGDYRDSSPSKLMFDGVIEWAQARNGTHLNLGGGLGGKEDSLFHFKKGWSDHTRPFHSLRVVPNQTRYRSLLEVLGESSEDDRTGFFPAYRQAKS